MMLSFGLMPLLLFGLLALCAELVTFQQEPHLVVATIDPIGAVPGQELGREPINSQPSSADFVKMPEPTVGEVIAPEGSGIVPPPALGIVPPVEGHVLLGDEGFNDASIDPEK